MGDKPGWLIVHIWKSTLEDFMRTFQTLVENDLKVDVANTFGFLDVTKNVIVVNVQYPYLVQVILNHYGMKYQQNSINTKLSFLINDLTFRYWNEQTIRKIIDLDKKERMNPKTY